MILTAFGKNQMFQLTLPASVKGQFWLYTGKDKNTKLVSVEGVSENWILKSNKSYRIIDQNNRVQKKCALNASHLIVVKSQNGEEFFIYSEPISEDRQIYKKYVVTDSVNINIGRSKDCDIVFDKNIVSATHATLSFENNKWYIDDKNSANGTFVNNERINYKELTNGDCIYIMGLKIIVSKNLVSLNNPDGCVSVSGKLNKFISQPINKEIDDESEHDIKYFYRSPRFKRNIENIEIKVDSPPDNQIGDETPIIVVLGTSLTMGLMSLVTLANAIIDKNGMSMAMGITMLLGAVLVPIITKQYDKRKKFRKEQKRQKKYMDYLKKIASQIEETRNEQAEIIVENVKSVNDCEKTILDKKRDLWERDPSHDDFLQVSIGNGRMPLLADVSCEDKKFKLDDDNLIEEMHLLCDTEKFIENVPMSFSFLDNYISGVIGNNRDLLSFAKKIIIQLGTLYSYNEVKFIFVYDYRWSDGLGFVKWLPHCWSNDNSFRFLANTTSEIKELSSYLNPLLEKRFVVDEKNKPVDFPYYVLFSFSHMLSQKFEIYEKILNCNKNLNFSIVSFSNNLINLPKECSTVIELNGDTGKLYDRNDVTNKVIKFNIKDKLNYPADLLSKKLANIYLNMDDVNYKLPDMITFLNLFEVGKVEHLNALTRWKENDPTKSLGAVVGVDAFGDKFYLDIHEKFHGPHGLIAGMTGSGKSEFIITYILSLAVNFHPEEVQFVMIDYKGGGMAKSFERLPHTVGIITNLDGSSIKRSLVSIESELKRRQTIFNEASKKVNVSNIDIYRYQKMYREGIVDEPLSHLLIISDEFAELKTQRPEFMTQLVSAARIGRSLGVHLILATQKPSGVVDDQIWSNSRFRVCLKVQERVDSQDMLKRPEAAELKETGRFYLQVGYNEYFDMGQSAWSGATYIPSDTVIKEKDESVIVIDNNAQYVYQARPEKKVVSSRYSKKQVDVITDYLCGVASDEGFEPHLLWLEPIPPVIMIDDIRTKYEVISEKFYLNPLIGEYDDPAKQNKSALTLPISDEGNTIIYGATGSGKTMLLNALVYSILVEHDPEEVNLFLLDFSSETLTAFTDAPHVADVLLSHEEDKVASWIEYLEKEINARKKMFADYGGSYDNYIKSGCDPVPMIVCLVNNYLAFSEAYEKFQDRMAIITRDGIKYGIHFVITLTSQMGVRFKILQNFHQQLALQLNDNSDYISIVGRTDGLFPAKYKGRGLINNEYVVEFQTASLCEESQSYNYIRQFCVDLKNKYKDYKIAKPLEVTSDNNVNNADNVDNHEEQDIMLTGVDDAHMQFLKSVKIEEHHQLKEKHNAIFDIEIGINESSSLSVIYPFGQQTFNLVLSKDEGINHFTEFLVEKYSKGLGFNVNLLNYKDGFDDSYATLNVFSTKKDFSKYINKVYKLFDSNESSSLILDKPEILIINNYFELYASVSKQAQNKLVKVLEIAPKIENFIIILIGSDNSVLEASFEDWYTDNIHGNNGIWIGNGIKDQYILLLDEPPKNIEELESNKYAYVVLDGKLEKVKLTYC